MIIVGAYPDQVFTNENDYPTLEYLKRFINALLPSDIVLHILPFYQSCGDGGFAIANWYKVDSEFGDWDDISDIACNRKVVIDGVFNHVGVENELVKRLTNCPKRYSALFHVDPLTGLDSPRGVNSNCEIETKFGNIVVRKTHSKDALDINLENDEIKKYVLDFINYISQRNICGLRLDAVAYYKKGNRIRHNEGSYRLANDIAAMVKDAGLSVISQLDADDDGKKYFCDSEFNDVAIYDFGYSAALSLSVVEKNPCALANFLRINQEAKRPLIRAPRTHDGILLRSGNLPPNQVDKLVKWATSCEVPIRVANGIPYELNCSLPFLIQKAYPNNPSGILEMILMLTGILNSIPYFYLPALVGFTPEISNTKVFPKRFPEDDPRTINRIPIIRETIEQTEFVRNRLPNILDSLSSIHRLYGEELIHNIATISTIENKLLHVSSANGAINGIFNFSEHDAVNPLETRQEHYAIYKGISNSKRIESGGYFIQIKLYESRLNYEFNCN